MPHRRLLLKLDANGISGKVLHWIQSWLTRRLQRVVLNSSVSDLMSVTSGVPSIRVGGRLPQSNKVYILTFGYLSKYLGEHVFPLYRICIEKCISLVSDFAIWVGGRVNQNPYVVLCDISWKRCA